MLGQDQAKRNSITAEERAKHGQKREGADSQNVGHFGWSAKHSAAFRRRRAPRRQRQ